MSDFTMVWDIMKAFTRERCIGEDNKAKRGHTDPQPKPQMELELL